MNGSFKRAEVEEYAKYYAVYAESNIFCSFDWMESLRPTVGTSGYFVFEGAALIGGFTWDGRVLSYPFIAAPFVDKSLFWRYVLGYIAQCCSENRIGLTFMCEGDELILTREWNAKVLFSERRMLRPTSKTSPSFSGGFYFAAPVESDKREIVQTVYEAHSAGYTSTVREPNKNDISDAIERRFALFSQTDTLHIGTLVRQCEGNAIAGVCIAGIYPDSPNNFSTIHQVSVRPDFRRRGLAQAMMLHSIGKASSISPVITLGVMVGNPAESLYRKLGFVAGPKYSELYVAL